MASPDTLDFAGLLAPISDDQPVGENIREDYSASSVYYQIKDARNRARAAERAMAAMLGDEDEGVELPDWAPVVDQAIAIKVRAVWMQMGIVHNQAAQRARDAKIRVIMNRCIMRDHSQMMKA